MKYLGAMLTGKIADIHGRKPAILISSIMLFLVSIGFYFSMGIYSMIFLRFLYGFCYGFSLPLPSSLISEITPTEWRGKSLVIVNFFVSIGKIIGCVLAIICLDNF